MTPEERREDAEDAVREWRDEMRQHKYGDPPTRVVRTGRIAWIDTGSGPGHEVVLPDEGGEERG